MRIVGCFYYGGRNIVVGYCRKCDEIGLCVLQDTLKLKCSCGKTEIDDPPLGYLKYHKPEIICYLIDFPGIDQGYIGLHFDSKGDIVHHPFYKELSRPKDFYCAMVDQMLYIKKYYTVNSDKNTLQHLLKKMK